MHNFKILRSLVILILMAFATNAQPPNIDSLRSVIRSGPNEKEKLKAYKIISTALL